MVMPNSSAYFLRVLAASALQSEFTAMIAPFLNPRAARYFARSCERVWNSSLILNKCGLPGGPAKPDVPLTALMTTAFESRRIGAVASAELLHIPVQTTWSGFTCANAARTALIAPGGLHSSSNHVTLNLYFWPPTMMPLAFTSLIAMRIDFTAGSTLTITGPDCGMTSATLMSFTSSAEAAAAANRNEETA